MKGVGEPSDRKGHARIDEEELETCVAPDEGWSCKPPTEVDRLSPIGEPTRRANSSLYFTEATLFEPSSRSIGTSTNAWHYSPASNMGR